MLQVLMQVVGVEDGQDLLLQKLHLNCLDPSEKAIKVATKNLSEFNNCSFECNSINDWSILENSDFGYCLGVLHHIPNTKCFT